MPVRGQGIGLTSRRFSSVRAACGPAWRVRESAEAPARPSCPAGPLAQSQQPPPAVSRRQTVLQPNRSSCIHYRWNRCRPNDRYLLRRHGQARTHPRDVGVVPDRDGSGTNPNQRRSDYRDDRPWSPCRLHEREPKQESRRRADMLPRRTARVEVPRVPLVDMPFSRWVGSGTPSTGLASDLAASNGRQAQRSCG